MKLRYWLLGLSVAVLSLWLAFRDPYLKWNEEVKLQSGEVIVIRRTAKFSENWIAGGGGGSFNLGMTIDFSNLETSNVPTMWHSLYDPLIIDLDPMTKEWIIIATFIHCDGWYNLGRPSLPYTEYRFQGGKWEQGPLNPHWIGRNGNLLLVDPSERKTITLSGSMVTLARKEKAIYDRPAIPEKYRKIVEKWTTGC